VVAIENFWSSFLAGEESLFKVTSSEPQSKAPVSGTTEFETSAYLVYSVDHAAKNLIKNHL